MCAGLTPTKNKGDRRSDDLCTKLYLFNGTVPGTVPVLYKNCTVLLCRIVPLKSVELDELLDETFSASDFM